MKKKLKLAERLVVAADVANKEAVVRLCDSLVGIGVVIKLNSVLRREGYALINSVSERGLKVFADLKLNDIPATMRKDGEFLYQFAPAKVTVMCSAGVAGMRAVKEAIGQGTEVLGVTVLTSFNDDECECIFKRSVVDAVMALACHALHAGLDGLICSPRELQYLRHHEDLVARMSFNTPGIRPEWAEVKGDDQSRTATIREAILAGADRVIIGRPITQAKNPREAVERTLAEIDLALEERRTQDKPQQ